MNYTQEERTDYNLHRDNVCRGLGITHNQYNYLRRLGSILHAIYEANCNGTIEESDYELETSSVYSKCDKYVKYLGLFVYYQADPRGATIYVSENEIPRNNYTSAYCIY